MKTLKNKYENKSAVLIFGGACCINYFHNIKNIDKKKYTIFLEAKSLTPKIIKEKIKFDYLLATFPEKLKDNSFQNLIFRSFLSGSNIKKYINNSFHSEVDYMKDNFKKFIEDFRPHKGIHKKFRYKKNIYLKNSPLDLLKKIENVKIITNYDLYNYNFNKINLNHNFFYIKHNDFSNQFDLEKYFNPILINNMLHISYSSFLNSAAINYYPIIKYMGFKKIFFLGMDMNLLGNLEYSANYIFKNIFLLNFFIFRNRKSFNANFKLNYPFYLRPVSEYNDLKELTKNQYLEFIRVSDQSKFEYKIPFLQNLKSDIFFNL